MSNELDRIYGDNSPKIGIFAIDPVPGELRITDWRATTLNKNVEEATLVYAQNEDRGLFQSTEGYETFLNKTIKLSVLKVPGKHDQTRRMDNLAGVRVGDDFSTWIAKSDVSNHPDKFRDNVILNPSGYDKKKIEVALMERDTNPLEYIRKSSSLESENSRMRGSSWFNSFTIQLGILTEPIFKSITMISTVRVNQPLDDSIFERYEKLGVNVNRLQVLNVLPLPPAPTSPSTPRKF